MSYKRNLSYQGWYNFLNIDVEDIGTNSEIILHFIKLIYTFFGLAITSNEPFDDLSQNVLDSIPRPVANIIY
jgi:hypothetical protein